MEQYSVDPQTGKGWLQLELVLQIENLIELGLVGFGLNAIFCKFVNYMTCDDCNI